MSEEEEPEKTPKEDDVRVVPSFDQPAPPKQRKWRFPFKTFIAFLILAFIVLCVTTSLPRYLVLLIPKHISEKMFAGIHQNITLEGATLTFNKFAIYKREELYPVYSYRSGVCFYFSTSIDNEDAKIIRAKDLIAARRGTPIATIDAIGYGDRVYKFDITTLNETTDDKGNPTSAVCQRLSKEQSLIPKAIKEFRIMPLIEFSQSRIGYVTTRELPREQREFRVGRTPSK